MDELNEEAVVMPEDEGIPAPPPARYYWNGTGFLVSGINTIPDDAVEITEEAWRALLAAQAEGKRIVTGLTGTPEAVTPEVVITADDYDRAMEEHLTAERCARGYTSREPSEYKDSSVPRWARDAADWIAHRDAVMLYGLSVMNRYAETGEAPSLEEFKAALPTITWSFTE